MHHDITDPRELLLIEVAFHRERLHALIERMRADHLAWERRVGELRRSTRLTVAQKDRLFAAGRAGPRIQPRTALP